MIRSPVARGGEPRREGVWPRVYRMRRDQRRMLLGLGGVAVVGGLVPIGVALLRAPEGAIWMVVAGLVFVGLGALLGRSVQVGELVLHEDALEWAELGSGRRRVRRDEIVGRRLVPLQHGRSRLVLELRGPGRRPAKIDWAFEPDAVLAAWLDAIPDLDAADRARAEAELLRSRRLGASEEELRRALAGARTVARGLGGIAMAICAWGWFYPRPYPLAVATLAALPLAILALVALGRGRFGVEGRRNDVRAYVGIPLLGPGLVLALRALSDLHLVDHRPLLVGAALATVALAGLVALAEPPLRRRWTLALLAALLFAHPWGALAIGNALLDRGPAQVFRVRVEGKRVAAGRQASHELRLAAWGPLDGPSSVDVGRWVYERVEVGGVVCAWLRPGALGARWYRVTPCDPAP